MKKLLLGLAGVLGLLLIAGVVASVLVYSFFKNNMPDAAPLEAVEARHEERFGPVPDVELTILEPEWAGRVETFVRIRRALVGPARAASEVLDRTSEKLTSPRFKESSKLSQIRQLIASRYEAIELARRGLGYLTARDSLLLDADMSRAEYAYLDAIVLFAWLGWDPDPRTAFEEPRDVQAYDVRLEDIRRDARRLARRLLRNHRTALRSLEHPGPGVVETLQLLDEEWSRLQDDPVSFPFEEGLTPGLQAALEPHEAFLRATLPRTLGESLVEALAFQHVRIRTGGIDITAY